MPNSVTYLHGTLVFEWYVVRYDSINIYQKGMCLKEIELHVRSVIITILCSIVDVIEGWGSLDDLVMNMRIFTMIMLKIFI